MLEYSLFMNVHFVGHEPSSSGDNFSILMTFVSVILITLPCSILQSHSRFVIDYILNNGISLQLVTIPGSLMLNAQVSMHFINLICGCTAVVCPWKSSMSNNG